MTNKKYIMVSLDDSKAKKIAEVLGNKTCKAIIDFLADTKEAGEKEIADKLNQPINTIEYNLKKLIESEIIEKTKNFFWSKKGKKIPMYTLSNKSIIISPKSRISSNLKFVLPSALISGLTAVAIRQYFLIKQVALQKSDAVFSVSQEASNVSEYARSAGESFLTMQTPVWIWFLAGALFALLIISIINLKGGKKNNE